MQRPEWPGLSRYPGPHRRVRKLPPADYSHAPPSERQDASPNQRILVLGDAMADWFGYGLEQLLSDQSELGVVRKINTESGLLKYVPGKGDPANGSRRPGRAPPHHEELGSDPHYAWIERPDRDTRECLGHGSAEADLVKTANQERRAKKIAMLPDLNGRSKKKSW